MLFGARCFLAVVCCSLLFGVVFVARWSVFLVRCVLFVDCLCLFEVRCLLLFVGCCFVACCLLHAVCRLACLLLVVCPMLCFLFAMWGCVCCMLFVVCCALFAVGCWLIGGRFLFSVCRLMRIYLLCVAHCFLLVRC